MRFSVDSNILVYAYLVEDEPKHTIASDLMIRAMLLDCVLPVQVLAEFLNVVRRKRLESFGEAQAQVQRWTETIQIVDTTAQHVLKGAEFSRQHRLQLWDSIILQVAQSAHSRLIFSEDFQDRFEFDGMRILNPFNPENEQELRAILSSADDQIEW